jgi:ubiquinone biosynthesis protein UbiJ
VSAPFPSPSAAALNHVLRSAPLAMERLRPYAGRTVAFHVGPLATAFTVQTTGEVTAALPSAARDLTVRISPALLPRLVAREEAAFRDIVLEGDMELAQQVSFLARHLTWDVEEDLSKVVGDIAAHRIVSAARGLSRWGRDATWRSAESAAEYWTEESPLIASRVKVAGFMRDVDELRDAVERLEKRIDRLA